MTEPILGSEFEAIPAMVLAWNAHDIEGLLRCFASDFRSDHPIHPNRSFRGTTQIRQNWEKIFGVIPDLKAELLRFALSSDENAVWIECRWHGTHADGSRYDRRGVMICGVRNKLIEWMRAFTDPVDETGPGVNEALDEALKLPRPSK